jgi:hypothetical protein
VWFPGASRKLSMMRCGDHTNELMDALQFEGEATGASADTGVGFVSSENKGRWETNQTKGLTTYLQETGWRRAQECFFWTVRIPRCVLQGYISKSSV